MNYDHLYIHVPFCAKKCDYCAFYSQKYSTQSVDQYLDQISDDLDRHALELSHLRTVFLGGGTPSLLSVNQLDRLLQMLPKSSCEFSIEINPETLTEKKAVVLAKHGVNRASFGVQTFDPTFRSAIGRHGDIQKLDNAVKYLLNVGITNLNFDFIYGLPNQTEEQWLADLKKALNYPIKHLSAYELTLEQDSILPERIEQEEITDFAEVTKKFLKQQNFSQYEISNFSLPGFECQHNSGIWHGDRYLGLGPAAASFEGVDRWCQTSSLEDWLTGKPPEVDRVLTEERAREVFVIGLRTVAGWDRELFEQKTGFSVQELYADNLLDDAKYFINTPTRVALTEAGLQLADHLAVDLI